jgi:ergothioneine biosynthesis protein EgtB
MAFIDDGGYIRPELWLSDGWAAAQEQRWTAPLYWRRDGDAWTRFSLHGLLQIDMSAPVVNISFYEADAYARWSGHRLATETEWEIAAVTMATTGPATGNFLSDGDFEPRASAGGGLTQMFGDAWEWTQSPYVPYPGFRPNDGAIAEYNGKFMVNQLVLRGGSRLTPADHIRATYRNFFYPAARWEFAGLRLAKDV